MNTNANIKSSLLKIHNDPSISVTDIVPSFELTDTVNSVENKDENKQWNFGILQLEMKEVPITKQPIFIEFDVDMSGSMIETDKHRKSRMQYVHNTFENMIRFIASQDIEVYIRVDGFDDTIQSIIKTCRVTVDNMEELVKTIKTMIPRGGTNIGLALENANSEIQKYKKENPTHKLFHILLTDGAATMGERDPSRLSREICQDYVNIFLGVGSGHNTTMLQEFANRKNSEYRFIDNGDNAGMVYGEILQRILRPAIEDIKIEMTCGEIYDWKSNTWQTYMTEDVIDSEATKTYHIRTFTPNYVEATIYGRVCVCTADANQGIQELDNVSLIPDLLNEDGTVVDGPCNLAKYLYRQQTLNFLNICSTFTVNYYYDHDDEEHSRNKEMRTQLAKFFRSMRIYMRANDLLNDSFMRTLCDDIVVAYKTVGTSAANMHCTSRNISQGAQRSCTTQCDDDMDYFIPPPPILRRQVGRNYNYNNERIDEEDIQYDNDVEKDDDKEEDKEEDKEIRDAFTFHNFDLGFKPTSKVIPLVEVDEDDINEYIMVSMPKMDIETAAYITPGRRQMMRAVSGR